jgi:hypothetical protein
MHTRAARFTLLAVLLAAGVGAAVVAWEAERRMQALEDERHAIAAGVERLVPAVNGIAAVQEAYIDSGQRDDAAFERVSALLDQMSADAAALRTGTSSVETDAHRRTFDTALAALVEADAQARRDLGLGESLIAADRLFGAARGQVASMAAALRALPEAEAAALRSERTALVRRSWATVAAVTLLWTAGLLALARVPASRREAEAVTTPAAETALTPAEPPAPPIDLPAAADLCAALSRMAETAALPPLLDRAAAILDASGIIVWMGAGEELFPATTCGYDPRVITRLGPIGRAADNATAAAWRTGEIQTVSGGDAVNGAIVAPMFDARGCIGVLAAEVRHGREHDAATRAVTTMIASQLAAALAAWPAASTPPAAAGAEGDDRQAAVS